VSLLKPPIEKGTSYVEVTPFPIVGWRDNPILYDYKDYSDLGEEEVIREGALELRVITSIG